MVDGTKNLDLLKDEISNMVIHTQKILKHSHVMVNM